jgi:ribonuclease P protein component
VGAVVVLAAEGVSGEPQVGFVADRRVGNAVERNRAKRRLREAMARTAPRDGMTFVVIARPGVNDAAFSQLVRWLDSACRESNESVGSEENDE